MKDKLVMVVFVLMGSLMTLIYGSPARPFYIECTSSDECGKGFCCTIGLGRFTIPTCRSRVELGDTCRPNGPEPTSTNVTYPDGTTVSLTDVYYSVCPCAGHYTCSGITETCVDQTEDPFFNYLDNAY